MPQFSRNDTTHKTCKKVKQLAVRNGNEILAVGDVVWPLLLTGSDVLQRGEKAKILYVQEVTEPILTGGSYLSYRIALQIVESPCKAIIGQKVMSYNPDSLTKKDQTEYLKKRRNF